MQTNQQSTPERKEMIQGLNVNCTLCATKSACNEIQFDCGCTSLVHQKCFNIFKWLFGGQCIQCNKLFKILFVYSSIITIYVICSSVYVSLTVINSVEIYVICSMISTFFIPVCFVIIYPYCNRICGILAWCYLAYIILYSCIIHIILRNIDISIIWIMCIMYLLYFYSIISYVGYRYLLYVLQ